MTLQANEDGLPKKRQKLETDIQAKQAKPEIRPYKLAAGGGLFLLVKAANESDSKGRPVALK